MFKIMLAEFHWTASMSPVKKAFGEKGKIFPFKKLEPENIQHFCPLNEKHLNNYINCILKNDF